MAKYRKTWRTLREHVFHKVGLKQKPFAPAKKAKRAMEKIKVTPKEKKAIFGFIKKAKIRIDQREEYHAKGYFFMDAYNSRLIHETEEVLGKDRATKFFDMCNDPYF